MLLTSARTTDGWLVDGMGAHSDVKFLDRMGRLVNVCFKGHGRGTTTTAPTTQPKVIDVDASPPVLQQIFAGACFFQKMKRSLHCPIGS